ncbi:MAG TPA: hypothetical protein VMH02_00030 [Verrucomicrobiae bacterium]|nr:hypothetical protein [Verrucomicrobiae bacterium]
MDQLEEGGEALGGNAMLLVLAWLWVGIPLLWGVAVTIGNAVKLFE